MLPDFSDRPAYMYLFLGPNLGVCGVAMFFVVSGFCIHLSHLRRGSEDPWFVDFFFRRVTRIYPPYLVALLLFSFVYPFGVVDLAAGKQVVNFFAHLFLVHNFFELEVFAGINPSFWSIAVEAQLYAIYPLLYFLAGRTSWKTCLVVCAVIEVSIRVWAAIALTHGTPLPRAITYSPTSFLLSWSIGAAIADAYVNKGQLPFARQSFRFWLICCLVCPHVQPLTRFNFLVVAVTTGVFIARSLGGEQLLPRFTGSRTLGRHLSFAGTVSYSCYLFHQPLINRVSIVVNRLTGIEFHPVADFSLTLATWPGMLVLSWVLYRWLEMPSTAMGRRKQHVERSST